MTALRCVLGACALAAWSVHAGDPSPAKLAARVRAIHAQASACTVALDVGGYATGVIVSPGGLVLTAAHVLERTDQKHPVTAILADGRRVSAQRLGYDIVADIGALQLEGDGPWPAATLAKGALAVGDFALFLGFPSGYGDRLIAQARLGRITTRSQREGEVWMLTADAAIQPGDSGGPFFSLDGRLAAIGSVASTHPGFNRFSPVAHFLRDRARYLAGERWGDAKFGPEADAGVDFKVSPKATARLQAWMGDLAAGGHRLTMQFVNAHQVDGRLQIDAETLAQLYLVETVALARGQPIGRGLDDPKIVRRLPKFPAQAAAALRLVADGKPATYALPVAPRRYLAKASEVDGSSLMIRHHGTNLPVRALAYDKGDDLVLLASDIDLGLAVANLSGDKPLAAGDLLMTRDADGLLAWGIAADAPRPITNAGDRGPLSDTNSISRVRTGFSKAVTHSMPLQAGDAGLPIYGEDGRLAGIHIARLSRTLGVLLPVDVLREKLEKLQEQAGS